MTQSSEKKGGRVLTEDEMGTVNGGVASAIIAGLGLFFGGLYQIGKDWAIRDNASHGCRVH